MTHSPNASSSEHDAYILGTSDVEVQRLQLQDALWHDVTEELWDAAGFRKGQHLLELGCGPGFSTLALAQRVGSQGSVLGWDSSAQFLRFLTHHATAQGLAQIKTHEGRISSHLEPNLAESFDGVFARWLLCWMEHPENALQLAHQALKPGGRLVVFDYFHYHSLDLLPHNPDFRRGINAVEAAWRKSGGDPSLGTRLPAMVEEMGFAIVRCRLCTRFALPADPLWQWPTSFFPGFMPQLVDAGFLSPAQSKAFLASFEVSKKHRQGLFLAPPMLELVAEKL